MKDSVKRRASRDETGMVGVQGSAEAEACSHQTPKRCQKAKIVEGSSDQPQEGGGKAEVVEGSSDQPKKGGPKTKLLSASGVKDAKKQERDKKRYKKMKDAVQKVEILEKENAELKRESETPKNETKEVEVLKNNFAEFDRELKTQTNETKELRVEVEKLNSELVPTIIENLKPVAEQLEVVKNIEKKMESFIEKFLQKEENGLMSLEIPWDDKFLQGEENTLMVLGPSNHISNEVPGMSNQAIMADFKKRLEELEKENKKLKSRVTAIETDKSKDAKK